MDVNNGESQWNSLVWMVDTDSGTYNEVIPLSTGVLSVWIPITSYTLPPLVIVAGTTTSPVASLDIVATTVDSCSSKSPKVTPDDASESEDAAISNTAIDINITIAIVASRMCDNTLTLSFGSLFIVY